MIKYLIAFLLIASPCLAGMGIGVTPYPGPGVSSGSAPPTYLVSEDGTGTGWTSSTVTWGANGTSLGMDSAVAYAPSLTDAATRSATKTFAATSEVWGYAQFYISNHNLSSGTVRTLIVFRNAGTIVQSASVYNLGGTLRLFASCGGAGVYTTDTLSEGTLYHLQMHYATTGTSSTCDVEFSTDGTFAGSGSKFAQKTGGINTLSPDRIAVEPQYASLMSMDVYYDKIRVDDVVIGSNPQ